MSETTQNSPDIVVGNSQFVVVWEDTQGNNDILGQRIAAVSGGPLLSVDSPIATGANAQIQPRVSYNQTADSYLVSWDETAAGETAIQGQRLDSNAALDGFAFEITSTTNNTVSERGSSLTYCPTSNDYFVAWQSDNALLQARGSLAWQVRGMLAGN